ncbi:hypothetical protein ES288_D12G070700v1 [Gossypium darwinii]|uniref:Uncharacterized protein n=1 Tax=Gossypium darwinii TaxID=34276 RepID=A0A5D2A8W6_GOSDA|nr:hypothetical protein ES288_D12G070700v1 [Gossypium darwinii]
MLDNNLGRQKNKKKERKRGNPKCLPPFGLPFNHHQSTMNDGWWSTKAFPLCLHLKPSLKTHQFRPQNPSQPSTPAKKTRIWWLVRKRHGVQTVMGMRGGRRGAEACEVEWLRTWGNGASGQVGGFAGMGPGRFWALHS